MRVLQRPISAALARALTLVTHNTGEFRRVPGSASRTRNNPSGGLSGVGWTLHLESPVRPEKQIPRGTTE
jgi:hypothetical protein